MPPPETNARTASTWRAGRIGDFAVQQSGMLLSASVSHAFSLPPENMQAFTRCRSLCAATGGDSSRLTAMEQVHGSRIELVTSRNWGRQINGVDGLITSEVGVTLVALSADCPLVLVCDPGQGVLGLVHAGWRGTIKSVARRLVRIMLDECGCRAESLLAAIAPSAGPCCYQVGDEVAEQAARDLPGHERFFVTRGSGTFFDLWSANVTQLCESGLRPERVDLAAQCTICDVGFFSYRRDGAATGHAALTAVLRSDD